MNSTYFKNFVETKQNKTLLKIQNLIYFFTGIITFLVFLFGTVSIYGVNLNILSAIIMIVNLLAINKGAVYFGLMSVVIGITYIIMLVIIIKNILQSISYFKNSIKKDVQFKDLLIANTCLTDTFQNCFRSLLTLIFIACMLLEYQINTLTILVLILNSIIFISTEFTLSKCKNYTINCCLYRTCCNALLALTLIFTCRFLFTPYFEHLIDGFSILSFSDTLTSTSLVSKVFSNIIRPILFVILQIIIIRLVYYVLSGNVLYLEDGQILNTTKTVMIFSIILFAINLAINSISGQLLSEGNTGETIPFLLLGIAMFLTSNFNNEKVLNETLKPSDKKEKDVSNNQPNDNNTQTVENNKI